MRLVKKTDRPEQKVSVLDENQLLKLQPYLLYIFCFGNVLTKELLSNSQYSIAMMGYADEHETIVLELTYNYGVTEYTKGNAYAQVRRVLITSYPLAHYHGIIPIKHIGEFNFR